MNMDCIVVLVVFLLVASLMAEHHIIDVERAENALQECQERGYKAVFSYRGYLFNPEPIALMCTYPEQSVRMEQVSDTKSYKEGYL